MLGDNLQKLRKEKNLTKVEVANQLSISDALLFSYENNKSIPNSETLKNIADFYNVTIDSLFDIKRDSNEVVELLPLNKSEKDFLKYYLSIDKEKRNIILNNLKLFLK